MDDEYEQFRGTDPLNWDTDGDGVADGAEVKIHETDPLDPKSVPPAPIPENPQ